MFVDSVRSTARSVVREARRARRNKRVFDSIIDLGDKPLEYISTTQQRTVSEAEAFRLVNEGDIIIVRDLLGKLGLGGLVDQLSRDHFGVPSEELANLHLRKSVGEIIDSTRFGRRSDLSLQIQSSIIARLLKPHADSFYIELDPNLRPHLPFEFIEKHEREIEGKLGRGKMNPHGQHKDSWRYHPELTLNFWVAVTDADAGNGMSLLPHSKDYHPKYREKQQEIHPDAQTYISMHYVTDLRAGDALIFLADLMHGSIINHSDRTRVAFSMRGSVERPRFHPKAVYNYIGYDRGRYRSLFMDKALGRHDWVPPSRDLVFDRLEPEWKGLDIVSKDKRTMEVRVGDTVRRFPRRCPHKGADLALGGLDADGNLLCPWHRMCIAPEPVDVAAAAE